MTSYDVASTICQALLAEDSAKNSESNTRRNSLDKSSGHSSRDAADLDLLREDGEWGGVSYEAEEAEEGPVARLARVSYEAEGVKEGAVARRSSLNLTPETPPPADMSVDQMMDEAEEVQEGAVARRSSLNLTPETQEVEEGAVARRSSLNLTPETPPRAAPAPADMSVDQMMDEVMQTPLSPGGASPRS